MKTTIFAGLIMAMGTMGFLHQKGYISPTFDSVFLSITAVEFSGDHV